MNEWWGSRLAQGGLHPSVKLAAASLCQPVNSCDGGAVNGSGTQRMVLGELNLLRTIDL